MRAEAGRAESQACTLFCLSVVEIIAIGCCCIKLILSTACIACYSREFALECDLHFEVGSI